MFRLNCLASTKKYKLWYELNEIQDNNKLMLLVMVKLIVRIISYEDSVTKGYGVHRSFIVHFVLLLGMGLGDLSIWLSPIYI